MKQLNQILIMAGVLLGLPTAISATENKHSSKPKISGSTDGVDNKPVTSLEHIQIRGIRGSLVKSIDEKRLQDTLVDAITAEDIGKFPDKNVAEALQRVTGVSLTRVQGEGERIGVRGTAPSQNRTYINGQSIASADWWISSQPNRGFNYTMLPSELVSSLVVSKAPEADHDEGSLGGSVDIQTRQPLDTEDDLFVATVQAQYSDLSEHVDPQLSLLYNTLSEDKRFGALISLVRNERSLRRDGLESWGWSERNYNQDNQGNLHLTKAEAADYTDIWSPGGGGSAVFQQQRVLSSAMLTLQYQPSDNWQLSLNSLYSQLDADNSNQNFLWQPSTVYERGGHITDYRIEQQTLVAANYSQVPLDSLKNDSAVSSAAGSTAMESIWRKSSINTSLVQLMVEHDIDYWHNSYQLGYTRASGGTDSDFTAQWSANTRYGVNTRAAEDIQTQYQVSPTDAKLWGISEVRKDGHKSVDDELFVQADFSLSLDSPWLQALQFGAKYKRHTRDYRRYRSRNGGLDGLAGQLDWTLADFSAPFPDDYLAGIGSKNTLKNYAFADINGLNRAFTSLDFVQTEEKPSSFDIAENSYAAYGKLVFSGDFYRGNLGIRLVHTDQQAGAYQQLNSDTDPFNYQWSTSHKRYTDILPSINIATDLSDSLVLRAAASKVMSRPEYHHLMPSTNYNVTQAQGSGGNPDLDPFRAGKFDLSLEWYFDEGALLSLATFHQNVESFIDIKRSNERYESIDMVINRPVNGAGGTIKGTELSWQQELVYGSGVIANYTYIDGERKDIETGEDINIPGHSEHTVNFTAYFENDWLSSRVAYNFRTDYATGVGEEISDDIGQWDANLSFTVTPYLSLVFEGINLTNETHYTYERNEFAPVAIYSNGRRFYAGVRLSL
ncbi:TonB-dependent receptor [Shewanella sairae]|uniref:TonB-dependent receptor n=1 Tax=Shewanella sairae TaxID=190310 RepID=A0ABQ4P051_9GAMM|nr:TonB-dependent receptor [Shewanella sairae]MCL1131797.1 TonB-dependent receptor [Shewanella sairae]GIU40825.1 TonB-dependent receptor [Shewanella sairae]